MFQSLFRQRRPKVVGRLLYESAVERARQPLFYTEFAAPDTIEGRFELYSLHVILLLHRLKGEGPGGPAETAQALFDIFVSCARPTRCARSASATFRWPRRCRKLGEAFYGRAKAYDAALDGDAGGELEALIGRTVFDGASRPRNCARRLRPR